MSEHVRARLRVRKHTGPGRAFDGAADARERASDDRRKLRGSAQRSARRRRADLRCVRLDLPSAVLTVSCSKSQQPGNFSLDVQDRMGGEQRRSESTFASRSCTFAPRGFRLGARCRTAVCSGSTP